MPLSSGTRGLYMLARGRDAGVAPVVVSVSMVSPGCAGPAFLTTASPTTVLPDGWTEYTVSNHALQAAMQSVEVEVGAPPGGAVHVDHVLFGSAPLPVTLQSFEVK